MKSVQPLQRWLTLQFVLAASVPLAVVAVLVWLMLLPQMRTEIGIRHQALARSIAGQVTTHLLGAERELRALAEYIDILGKQWPQFWFKLLDSHAGAGDVFDEEPDLPTATSRSPTVTVPQTRAAPTQGPGIAATDKWALWVDGPHLRGANIYQRRVYPELDGPEFLGPGPLGPPYTQEDLDRLSALGANYVNVSHPGPTPSTSSQHARRSSATLQAWAMQPRGA